VPHGQQLESFGSDIPCRIEIAILHDAAAKAGPGSLPQHQIGY
jgi:hypothetical protein